MSDEEILRRFARFQALQKVALEADETPQELYTRHGFALVQRVWWFAVVAAAILISAWFALWRVRTSTLFIGLFAGAAIAACVVLFLFYLDWRDDALILTNVRLIHVERVFFLFKSQQEISLRDVQNVSFVVRGFVATVFNFGAIKVETAARVSDVLFGPILNPKAAQQAIMARVQNIQAASSRQIMEQTLLHHIDPAHYPPPQLATASTLKPGRQRWLPLPPNPKFDGNTITWYQHDYFLFRIFLGPLLLIAAVIAAGIALGLTGVPFFLWLIWAGFLLLSVLVLLLGYQHWFGHHHMLTPDRVIEVNRTPWGLFGEARRTVNLVNVQDITYRKPGVLANVLNFGDVTVSYAGGKLEFKGVPMPADVQQEIYRRQRLFRLQEEQRRRDRFAEAAAIFRKIDRPGT